MIIKDTKKFLRFIILMLVSYLLVACSAELDQARPVNFAVINSQNSTSQEMCQEGIQATFTMLSDQSEYASPRLGVGEEYRSESSGFYTSQDKVRISVQCFEANNVTGVLVVEGNIKPNHFINLPINAPPRSNVSYSVIRNETCTQDLVNDTRAYQLEILELVEPVPCISGRFNPRPD